MKLAKRLPLFLFLLLATAVVANGETFTKDELYKQGSKEVTGTIGVCIFRLGACTSL